MAQPQRAPKSGLVKTLLTFLDRHMKDFSQPARDTIGVGILVLLFVYVVNGVLGPTYIRGQLWVNGEHAAGWRVLHGDDEAVSNNNGWWTLPISGGGIPGRIRIEVEDAGTQPMGSFTAIGPWPVWNTFRPMDNYLIRVNPAKPPDDHDRLRVETSAMGPLVIPVYAQEQQGPQAQIAQQVRQVQQSTPPQASCALSLDHVALGDFPGFLRSSGRAYFQVYKDDQPVDSRELLSGSGIGGRAGQFPLQPDKELWIPVRAGSDDTYKGLLANLSGVADCTTGPSGAPEIRPKGRLSLKMFTDRGDLLGSFDLKPALAEPNREVTLQSSGSAVVKVQALAQAKLDTGLVPGVPQRKPAHTQTVRVSGGTAWMDTGIVLSPGDGLWITAAGQVRWDGNGAEAVGPGGSKTKLKAASLRPQYPVAAIGAGGLIARIGSGRPFAVGERMSGTAVESGSLFLGINDNSFANNSGQFSVTIEWGNGRTTAEGTTQR